MKYLKVVGKKSDLKNPHYKEAPSVYGVTNTDIVKYYITIDIPITFSSTGSAGSFLINAEYGNGIYIQEFDTNMSENESSNKVINDVTYYAFDYSSYGTYYIDFNILENESEYSQSNCTLYYYDSESDTMTAMRTGLTFVVKKNATDEIYSEVISYDAGDSTAIAHQEIMTLSVTNPTTQSTLTSLDIPDGVTAISSRGLENCTALESVTMPSTLTSIGEHGFDGCENLKTVTLSNELVSIGTRAFNGCESLETITIPDSVTTLSNGAFEGCKSLKSVKLPSTLTYLDTFVFWGCKSLESIDIPETVVEFNTTGANEGDQFGNCTSLKTITIPNKVETLGNWTFYQDTSLESVVLPDNLKNLCRAVFQGCTGLKTITYKNVNYTNSTDLKNALTANGVSYSDSELFNSCTF